MPASASQWPTFGAESGGAWRAESPGGDKAPEVPRDGRRSGMFLESTPESVTIFMPLTSTANSLFLVPSWRFFLVTSGVEIILGDSGVEISSIPYFWPIRVQFDPSTARD